VFKNPRANYGARIMATKDRDIRTCKVCGQNKVRLLAGMFDKRNKKFVDEDGNVWNGRTCPPCNTQRIAEAMRIKRAKE
jgi:ssDNA-binding Zn-finger/Zn-ribbon topoisomerase 1